MSKKQELKDLISKADTLTPDQEAAWGKMTPQHMIEHLAMTFSISSKKSNIQIYTPENKLPAMKAFLMSDAPIPRNTVSPAVGEDLLPLKYDSLDMAVAHLNKNVSAFFKFFEADPEAKLTNPAFGDLSFDEWLQFHKKHVTHHFTQFNLI